MIGATFWSFASMGPYVACIPYTQNAGVTGPYLWSNQGANTQFQIPAGAPGCRVGAVVGQFLFLGDLYDSQLQNLFIGNGSTTTYSGSLPTPIATTVNILDQSGTLGTYTNGVWSGSVSGSLNYATGALSITLNTAPPTNDQVAAQFTQVAPYRCWWSAIGDPTNWPTPLTNSALAVQSGYNDLQADLGPVMFVAGYPLYGLVFQRYGITRAQYIGGNVVFSWQPYEFKRGLIAHGAAIKVGTTVYFLADDGFWMTDGANVYPVGTAQDNSGGIDRWFWNTVNTSALESIRAGYDSVRRAIFFAIPTGTNTLPDTLLIYNLLAQRWTKAAISVDTIWTTDNGVNGTPGTVQLLGIIDQNQTPNTLSGSPLTGYLETCDAYFTDGANQFVSGARPHIQSSDLPFVVIGTRNSLADAVNYATGSYPDVFSRTAPSLPTPGTYVRARVQSTNAMAMNGATLLIERGGTM